MRRRSGFPIFPTSEQPQPNRAMTQKHKIFTMSFAKVYACLVAKAERKGRSKAEVDEIIRWLTGYSSRQMDEQIANGTDVETFFAEAPRLHPASTSITGSICGVRIEEIEDPAMREIRYLDKLVDELAKGRPMAKILRQTGSAG
jgi:hypothetical protein